MSFDDDKIKNRIQESWSETLRQLKDLRDMGCGSDNPEVIAARLELHVGYDVYRTHYRSLLEAYVEDDDEWPNI